MTDEQTQAPTEEIKRNDQAIPSSATWTAPWEGNINRPRPVASYQPKQS